MKCEGWQETILGGVCKYATGKISVDEVSVRNYVSTENMIPDKGGINTASGVPSTGVVSAYCFGDVLVSNIRPYFKKIWRAIESGGCSADVLNFRANDICNSEYLYYLLSQDAFFDYSMATAKGTKMPRGDKTALMNYPVCLPPLPEQRAIAATLSCLDDKIELNRRINSNLEELAQAIFKRWFVDFEFPDENGKPYKSSGGAMVDSELGLIPEGWRVGKISDIGTVIGGSTPSKARDEYYTDRGIAWITPKDLSGNKRKFILKGEIDITGEGLKNSSVQIMPKGTVLFSSRAPIGYIAIAQNEVTTNQGFKSVVPKNNVGIAYVYFFLKHNTATIENRASGSTFKEVSGSIMKQIPALVPSDTVLAYFQENCISFFQEQELLEDQIQTISALRDSLLPKLMSGEVRVPVEEE